MRRQHIHLQHIVLMRWYLLPNLSSASSLKALSSSRISASASSSSNSKQTILWPRNPPAPVTRQLTPARDIALGCSSAANWLPFELRPVASPLAWGRDTWHQPLECLQIKSITRRRNYWKTNWPLHETTIFKACVTFASYSYSEVGYAFFHAKEKLFTNYDRLLKELTNLKMLKINFSAKQTRKSLPESLVPPL